MPLFSFEGKRPAVHPEAWVAPTATLIGDVTLEAGASVWYGAVIRADFAPVIIRAGANVQDNSVIHVDEHPCEVGPAATIGHLCMVHGASIGANSVIGNGATILNGARVGSRAVIAAGATVTPDAEVPDEVVAVGMPARKHLPLTGSARMLVDTNAAIYRELAKRHRAGAELIEE